MGGGVILLAGFLEPICGNGIVLSHPLAQVTHDSEVVLSPGVAFSGRLAEPLGGFLEILIDADALVKQKSALVVLVGGGSLRGTGFRAADKGGLTAARAVCWAAWRAVLAGVFFGPGFDVDLGAGLTIGLLAGFAIGFGCVFAIGFAAGSAIVGRGAGCGAD